MDDQQLHNVAKFVQNIRNQLANRKIANPNAQIVPVYGRLDSVHSRGGDFEFLRTVVHPNSNMEILMVILPKRNETWYAAVKKFGDCHLGLPTICVDFNKAQKKFGDQMFAGNIALKYQLKLKGITHHVDYGNHAEILKNTIVLGADVTHPGPGAANGCPSIAAVVGSVDAAIMTFPGSMRLQAGRQEVSPF